MTKEQQDKLRRALYNAKFTTDAEDKNPFVGIYFNDLLDIIHDFGQQHPNWIPVERELPKENEEVLAYNAKNEEVIACDYHHKMFHCWPEAFRESITHWMPMPQPPQGKEGKE